jgi:hypothetical protein
MGAFPLQLLRVADRREVAEATRRRRSSRAKSRTTPGMSSMFISASEATARSAGSASQAARASVAEPSTPTTQWPISFTRRASRPHRKRRKGELAGRRQQRHEGGNVEVPEGVVEVRRPRPTYPCIRTLVPGCTQRVAVRLGHGLIVTPPGRHPESNEEIPWGEKPWPARCCGITERGPREVPRRLRLRVGRRIGRHGAEPASGDAARLIHASLRRERAASGSCRWSRQLTTR